MALLLSVIGAAQDVNVKLVGDKSGGVTTWDVIVPLAAAVVGVVIAGLFNRSTLTKLDDERHTRDLAREKERSEREDRMDDLRAKRERALENERQRRTDNAYKRQALGALRTAQQYLFRTRNWAFFALDNNTRWPMSLHADTSLRSEDAHDLASWLTPVAFEELSRATNIIGVYNATQKPDTPTSESWHRMVRQIHEQTTKAILALRAEEIRLAREIDAPDADHEWEPLPEHVIAPFAGPGA